MMASHSSIARLGGRPMTPTVPLLRQASWWLFLIGSALAVIGLGTESPPMVAAATGALALGFVCADLALIRSRQVGPITLYAVGAAVLSFADVVGLRAQNTDRRPLYFLYAVDEFLLMSALMSLAGLVLTVLGFWLVGRNRGVS